MKIYLSGPMTGIENYNRDTFNEATACLREAGHKVFNPAEVVLNEDDVNAIPGDYNKNLWNAYMRICLPHVPTHHKLMLLPGWEDSRGARLEVHNARELDIPTQSFTHWLLFSEEATDKVFHERRMRLAPILIKQLEGCVHVKEPVM